MPPPLLFLPFSACAQCVSPRCPFRAPSLRYPGGAPQLNTFRENPLSQSKYFFASFFALPAVLDSLQFLVSIFELVYEILVYFVEVGNVRVGDDLGNHLDLDQVLRQVGSGLQIRYAA